MVYPLALSGHLGVRVPEFPWEIWAWFPALGVIVGLSAGMFGIGGGLVTVPALAWLFMQAGFAPAYVMHMALGTSLATIAITSFSAVYAHHKRGAVLWFAWRRLVPGMLIGSFAGAAIAHANSTDTLRIFFGLLVIALAVYIGIGRKPTAHVNLPGRTALTVSGGAIGVLAALGGIGGGSLTNALLLWCRVDIRKSVATAAATTFPVAIAAALGYVLNGHAVEQLPSYTSGYVYWPAVAGISVASVFSAPVGVWLAHTLDTALLKRTFAFLLAVFGIRMLIG